MQRFTVSHLPPSNVSQKRWPPCPGHTPLCQTSPVSPVRGGVDLHTKPAGTRGLSDLQTGF